MFGGAKAVGLERLGHLVVDKNDSPAEYANGGLEYLSGALATRGGSSITDVVNDLVRRAMRPPEESDAPELDAFVQGLDLGWIVQAFDGYLRGISPQIFHVPRYPFASRIHINSKAGVGH